MLRKYLPFILLANVALFSFLFLFSSTQSQKALAITPTLTQTPQEVPTPTAEIVPTPPEEITPTVTVEVTLTPTETISENQPSVSPEVTGDLTQTTSTETPPTPTVTTQPTETGHLQAVILKDTEASSVDSLDLEIQEEGSAKIATDKLDYAPTDTVLITGSGFLVNKSYTIYITSETGPFSFSDEVTSDDNGDLFYSYQLDGTYRPNYKAELKNSAGIIVATTTFTDTVVNECGTSTCIGWVGGVCLGWVPGSSTPGVACSSDTNACTADVCGNAIGECTHVQISCNDGDPNTVDSCDTATGCTHVFAPAPGVINCPDGNACTTDSFTGVMLNCDIVNNAPPGMYPRQQINCDDGNALTIDTCNSETGCVYTPVSQTCDDGNACTGNDVSLNGGTCAGQPVTCDDSNVGTTDTCNPASGCVFTPTGSLVINEIDYDQPGTDTAEFIEIKNNTAGIFNIANYKLQLINGNPTPTQYDLIDLPDANLNSGDYYVICGDSATVSNCDLDVTTGFLIQNGGVGGDAVALYDPTGILVDTVSYDGNVPGYTEGTGAIADSSSLPSQGLSRCPDGQDTNINSSDFALKNITPGSSNACESPASCGNGIIEGTEVCDGEACCNTDCTFKTVQTECRAQSIGAICDVAEMCTGSSADCPADTFAPNTTECRVQDGACDLPEYCTGTSNSCPVDGVAASDITCRNPIGVCDATEFCDGSTKVCPADSFASNTTMCRFDAGDCDVAEYCTGSAATCPNDTLEPGTTVCRASAGFCDVAEQCTGISSSCPSDGFIASTVQCRAASPGGCDVAENCSGSGSLCPTDGFAPHTTVCRGAAGLCDIAESCTGSSASCPANAVAPSTTVCRASVGPCDVDDNCSGSAATCPTADAKAMPGTICNAPSCTSSVASPADTCNGTGSCIDNGTISCNPYICGATACKTMCATNSDCQTGYVCNVGGTCSLVVCGDGITEGTEACDDADTSNDDGCSATCMVESGYTCVGSPSICTPTCVPSTEICDGIDNDCDLSIDEDNPGGGISCTTGLQGICSAGATQCIAGALTCSQLYPPVSEICDAKDNDCDGSTDEGVTTTYYRDFDGDTYGDPGLSSNVCSQPAGYTNNDDDCNDASASIHPGATEICDSIDNNCDTQVDEGGVCNDAPTISSITDKTINEDTSTGAISFTVGDTDNPVAGLTLSGTSSNTSLVPVSRIVFGGSAANRTVTVTPLENKFGTTTITVTVSDGTLTSSTSFLLTVNSINDPPVANPQTVSTDEDISKSIILTGTDVDADPLTFNIITSPTKGVLSGTAPNLTYTPNANVNGTDTFTFRVHDGLISSAQATVTINIAAVNDPPVAVADSYTTNEDAPLIVPVPGVLGNDTDDGGSILSSHLVTSPAHGILNLIANGNFTYTPTLNFNGSDSFTYYARDPALLNSNTVTVSLTVNPVSDAPSDISLSPSSIPENQPVGTTVGTLTTTDADSLIFTYTLVGGTGDNDNASFSINGSTLKTSASFNYEAKSTYTIRVQTSDGTLTNQKQFTITVTNVNEPPANIMLTNSNIAENSPNGTTIGSLSTTDQDAGDTFTYSVVTAGVPFNISGSSLKVNGPIDFETNPSYAVTVRSTDAGALHFDKTFTITVTDVVEASCGNGITETGETCDDADAVSGDGCSATCVVESGYTCTGTPSVCTPIQVCGNGIIEAGEDCDGGDCCGALCLFKSTGQECRGAAGECDVPESCTGSSTECPTDGFAPSTVMCRIATDLCDVAAYCTGANQSCPANKFQPNTYICRASAGDCDVVETCTGSGAACPVDVVQTLGTSCPDGDSCNGNEVCDGTGLCINGTPLSCSPYMCNADVGCLQPCDGDIDCVPGNICNASGQCVVETDGDGIPDEEDNCPDDPNENQLNSDGDSMGNICDPDDDNDGVVDGIDAMPLNPRVCQDTDSDTCDDCSQNPTSSSSLNTPPWPEWAPSMSNDGADNDADLICNVGDTDDDNDGVTDTSDENNNDPYTCRDLDNDTCNDCVIGIDGYGPLPDYNQANDGPDLDSDGFCDDGDAQTCGNETVENVGSTPEQCDDGNINSNDGCSSTCQIETGTLKVIKTVADASETPINPNNWSINVKQNGIDVAGSPQVGSGTGTIYTLTPGTYQVVEPIRDVSDKHFDLSFSGACTQVPSGSPGHWTTANVIVATGQESICYLTNTRWTDTMIVHKEVDTNGDGVFEGDNAVANGLGFRWGFNDGPVNREMGTSLVYGLITNPTSDWGVHENTVSGYHYVGYYILVPGPIGSCSNPYHTTYPNPDPAGSPEPRTYVLCNARDTGSVEVYKKIDTDGDGDFEGGNTEANQLGFTWSINNGTANQMGTTLPGIPTTLDTDTHSVTESSVTGYHTIGWYLGEGSCNTPDGTILPAEISVTKDGTTGVTFCNVIDAFCGDGLVEPNTEECDGNLPQVCTTTDNYNGTQSCNTQCTWDVCQSTESCGDGIKNGNEECDGNDGTQEHYRCAESCTLQYLPYCGDGQINQSNEQCDDGNSVNGDGCNSTCQKELPGSISGFVYYDINKNNKWDGLFRGEIIMSGWKIFIDQNNNKKYDTGEKYNMTKGLFFVPNASYSFNKLPLGTYNICEVIMFGWISSLPSGTNCQQVTIGSGENKTGINFGNFIGRRK